MTEPARYEVEVSAAAEADLNAIGDYIAATYSDESAREFVAMMLDRVATLETFPLRGSVPKELAGLQRRNRYHQIVTGPHRIIYRVDEARVVVILVADGRRDMQRLLRSRLLGG